MKNKVGNSTQLTSSNCSKKHGERWDASDAIVDLTNSELSFLRVAPRDYHLSSASNTTPFNQPHGKKTF